MRESIDNRLFFVYNNLALIRSCGKVGRKKGMVIHTYGKYRKDCPAL